MIYTEYGEKNEEIKEFCNDTMEFSNSNMLMELYMYILMSKDSSVKHIGSGSHGNVYSILNNKYVIKIFTEKGSAGEYLDYLNLEKLSGIEQVPIMYAYKENIFVIMERVKGVTLQEYRDKYSKLPENIVQLITDAIHNIHNRNLVMPDFKLMEEVFFDEETNKIKFVDFGLCDDLNIILRNGKNNLKFVEQVKEEYLNSIITNIEEATY